MAVAAVDTWQQKLSTSLKTQRCPLQLVQEERIMLWVALLLSAHIFLPMVANQVSAIQVA